VNLSKRIPVKPDNRAARNCGIPEEGIEEMFTVKYVKPDGSEFISECASFYIERVKGAMERRFFTYDTPYRTGDWSGLWVGSPEKGDLSDETIYVMNRFGATVATHRFQPASDDARAEAYEADSVQIAA
jgi:hypothetical protein